MRASDAVMRCRCKIILSLVQGKTPTMIALGGLCAKSQVYRVAERFIEHGPVGLADRRKDNGLNKVTDPYGMEFFCSLKARLKSMATAALPGHKSCSFWCSLNEQAFASALPQCADS
jgi:Winged helix-turn helix